MGERNVSKDELEKVHQFMKEILPEEKYKAMDGILMSV